MSAYFSQGRRLISDFASAIILKLTEEEMSKSTDKAISTDLKNIIVKISAMALCLCALKY